MAVLRHIEGGNRGSLLERELSPGWQNGKKKVKSLLLVGYIMSHIENSSP